MKVYGQMGTYFFFFTIVKGSTKHVLPFMDYKRSHWLPRNHPTLIRLWTEVWQAATKKLNVCNNFRSYKNDQQVSFVFINIGIDSKSPHEGFAEEIKTIGNLVIKVCYIFVQLSGLDSSSLFSSLKKSQNILKIKLRKENDNLNNWENVDQENILNLFLCKKRTQKARTKSNSQIPIRNLMEFWKHCTKILRYQSITTIINKTLSDISATLSIERPDVAFWSRRLDALHWSEISAIARRHVTFKIHRLIIIQRLDDVLTDLLEKHLLRVFTAIFSSGHCRD
ncbi:hypothetical protein AGLY_010062 [Aphis glycines]|uniref:Uncharacterized protein n=1 Tax=Aphis glycines TaxID=307491 RepID=A0A6G0TH56_APHGL|nr:hypothetical protein AGLY_010062 [Aphis glycines]